MNFEQFRFADIPIYLQETGTEVIQYALLHPSALIALILCLVMVSVIYFSEIRKDQQSALKILKTAKSPFDVTQDELKTMTGAENIIPNFSICRTVSWPLILFLIYGVYWMAAEGPQEWFGWIKWIGWGLSLFIGLVPLTVYMDVISGYWFGAAAFLALAAPPWGNLGYGVTFILALLLWLVVAFYRFFTINSFKAFLWSAEANAILGKKKKLQPMLEDKRMEKADPSFVTCLKAQLALAKDKPDKAASLLSLLPPGLPQDRIRIELDLKAGDTDAALKRLALLDSDTANDLLRRFGPRGQLRVLRLKLHALQNDWNQVEAILKDLPSRQAFEILLDLKPSEERDRLLLPRLREAGRTDDLLEQLDRYPPQKVVQVVDNVLPEGPDRDRILVKSLAERSAWKELDEILESWEIERAQKTVMDLPESIHRNTLLAQIWFRAGKTDDFASFFKDRSVSEATSILESFPAGLQKDRFLARIHHQAKNFQEAAALLKPHFSEKKGQLTPSDLICLADCLDRLGKPEQAMKMLEQLVLDNISDKKTVIALCAKCRKLKTPSRVINNLTASRFKKMDADSLWACVRYYRFFDAADKADAAAANSFKLWKDERAAHFLGWRAEMAGDVQKAIQFYNAAGSRADLYKGICLLKNKQWQKAFDILSKATARPDNRATLFYHRGYALFRLGRLKEALAAYRSADLTGKDPAILWDCASLLCRMGYMAAKRGEFKQAVEHFEESLETAPPIFKKEPVQDFLKFCYCRLAVQTMVDLDADPDRLKELLDSANKHSRNSAPDLHLIQSLFYLKTGTTENALNELPEKSRSPQVLFHRALAAASNGNTSYAKKVFSTLAAGGEKTRYPDRAKMMLAVIAMRENEIQTAENLVREMIHE